MAKRFLISIQVKTSGVSKSKGEIQGLGGAAGKAAKGVDLLKVGAASMGAVLGALGVAKVTKEVIDFAAAASAAYQKQAAAEAQLTASVKSTGMAAGLTTNELKKLATEVQGLTAIGDEAVIKYESLLLTFTNISGDVFPRATRAIADMATKVSSELIPSQEELKTAAIQVGKALNDPIKGLTALARVGVQFTESQRDAIVAMVETNDVAGAQAAILEELERQFGGSAKAARETFGGAVAALKNQWGDLLENFGETSEVFTPLVEGMAGQLEELNKNFAAVQMVVIEWARVIVDVGATALSIFADGVERVTRVALTAASVLATFQPGMRALVDELSEGADEWGNFSDSVDGARAAFNELADRGMAKALLEIQGYATEIETAGEKTGETAEEVENLRDWILELYRAGQQAAALAPVAAEIEKIEAAVHSLTGSELKAIGEGFEKLPDVIEPVTFEIKEGSGELFEFGRVAAQVFADMDGDMGGLVQSVALLLEAMEGLGTATTKVGKAMEGLQLGQAIAGMAGQLGLVDPESSYSGEGGAVGGAIGGSFGPMWAAIGGAVGTALGAIMKKGADEALATFSQVGDDLTVSIDKIQGELGEAIEGFTAGVIATIDQLESALGAEITTGDFGVKIRDGIITVFINGIEAAFESAEEAILFTVQEILKTADITGPAAAALTDIANNSGTMEEFLQQVGLLSEAIGFGLNPEVTAAAQHTRELVEMMTRYGLATDGVTDDLDRMADAAVSSISQWIDTGIDPITAAVAEATAKSLAHNAALEAQIDLIEQEIAVTDASSGRMAELVAALAALQSGVIDMTVILDAETRARKEEAKAARGAGKARRAERLAYEDSLDAIILSTKDAGEQIRASYDRQIEAIKSAKFHSDQAADAIAALGEMMDRELTQLALDVSSAYASIGIELAELVGDQDALIAYQRLQHEIRLEQIRIEIEMMAEGARKAELWTLYLRATGQIPGTGIEGETISPIPGDGTVPIPIPIPPDRPLGPQVPFDGPYDPRYGGSLGRWWRPSDAGPGDYGDPERGAAGASTPDPLLRLQERLPELQSAVVSFVSRGLGPFQSGLRSIQLETKELTGNLNLARMAAELAGTSTALFDDALRQVEAEAERATQQVGFEFLDSLTALGVALPVEVTEELAEAQLALAKAQAIATALELEAAGAFVELSFSLQDLIGWIDDAGAAVVDVVTDPIVSGGAQEGDTVTAGDGKTYVYRGGRWVLVSSGGGGGGGGGVDDSIAQAQAALEAFRRAGMDPLTRDLLELEEAFASIRDVLGDTAEVQAAYADALDDLLERHLQPLVNFLEGLTTSSYSPLTLEQQYAEAQAALQAAVAGGDIAGAQSAAQTVLDLAAQLFPRGGAGYADVFDQIRDTIADMIDTLGSDGLGSINDQQNAYRRQTALASEEQVTELRGIRQDLARSAADAARREERVVSALEVLGSALPDAFSRVA